MYYQGPPTTYRIIPNVQQQPPLAVFNMMSAQPKLYADVVYKKNTCAMISAIIFMIISFGLQIYVLFAGMVNNIQMGLLALVACALPAFHCVLTLIILISDSPAVYLRFRSYLSIVSWIIGMLCGAGMLGFYIAALYNNSWGAIGLVVIAVIFAGELVANFPVTLSAVFVYEQVPVPSFQYKGVPFAMV